MNVAIFENEHYEGSYPVIRLFDIPGNKITIFTNETCYRQFRYLFGDEMNRFDWVVQTANQSKYDFIYFIRKEVRKRNIDLLWLNTISNNHIVYSTMIASLPKNMRVISTIHDINGYFTFKPAFSFKRIVRYLGKRRLIHRVKEFNVVSSTMVAHLQGKLPADKIVHNIPGCIFEPDKYVNPSPIGSGTVKVVIPGSVDIRRRNYLQVFELLHLAKEKNIKIQITLLGGFNKEYGSTILAMCLQHQYSFNNLKFFDTEIVDQPVFDKVMNESHFVWLPSVRNTILFDGVTETYGESICSGNIFDVIKHARPCIVPEFLKIPSELESSFLRISAVKQICELMEISNYEQLAKTAYSNSLHFTAMKLREQHPSLFQPK